MEQRDEVSLLAPLSPRIYKETMPGACFYPQEYTRMCDKVCVQHCARQTAGIRFTPNTFSAEHPLCSREDISLEQERGALACRDGDAGGDADAVVDDSEHVDVVFHACLQARDGAGSGIAWNPNL